jgi:hypothetical protein
VGSDRQTRSEDLVFQIGRDALSPRRPQCGIATLHAQPPSIAASAAVAPHSKFLRWNRCEESDRWTDRLAEQPYRAVRDILVRHRDDYDAAVTAFRWPSGVDSRLAKTLASQTI